MVYCSKCGMELLVGETVCPNCNAMALPNPGKDGKAVKFPRKPNGTIITSERPIGIVVILSLIIPGSGSMYVGEIQSGLLFFIGIMICTFLAVFNWILAVVLVAIWAYSVYYAYNAAMDHNRLWYRYLRDRGLA